LPPDKFFSLLITYYYRLIILHSIMTMSGNGTRDE
jgi:hypothetical protein